MLTHVWGSLVSRILFWNVLVDSLKSFNDTERILVASTITRFCMISLSFSLKSSCCSLGWSNLWVERNMADNLELTTKIEKWGTHTRRRQNSIFGVSGVFFLLLYVFFLSVGCVGKLPQFLLLNFPKLFHVVGTGFFPITRSGIFTMLHQQPKWYVLFYIVSCLIMVYQLPLLVNSLLTSGPPCQSSMRTRRKMWKLEFTRPEMMEFMKFFLEFLRIHKDSWRFS